MKREANIDLFICRCGGTLKEALDIEELSRFAGKLPGVGYVRTHSALCTKPGLETLQAEVKKSSPSRVVIAACSPLVCENQFREVLRKTGINPYLLTIANIREQCAWVCRDKQMATEKAKRLLQTAVGRSAPLEPIQCQEFPVNRDVLVVGGGITGLQCSLRLAEMGHKVFLVEKQSHLGGHTALLPHFYQENPISPQQLIAGMLDRVQGLGSDRIEVLTSAELLDLKGQVGGFMATVNTPKNTLTLPVGTVVVATGYNASPPEEDLRRLQKVITLLELEKALGNGQKSRLLPWSSPHRLRNVAFILDQTSEQDKTATGAALKDSILLKERFGCEVYLFCKNMRVAGDGLEELYRTARQRGTVIVKYSDPLAISTDNSRLGVQAKDELSGAEFRYECDLLVLADTLLPQEETKKLAALLKVNLGPDGFYQDDNPWQLPVGSNREGIFFVGASRGQMDIQQALTDAEAAAGSIHQLLGKGVVTKDLDTASIDPDKCVLCLNCLRTCPNHAIQIDHEKEAAVVVELACQSCGTCASECPAKAIQLANYTDDQMLAETELAPKLVVYCCQHSAYPAADLAGRLKIPYSDQTLIVRVPCAAKIDLQHLVKDFENGARGVLVLACHEDACQHLNGNLRASKRVELGRKILEELGIAPERLDIGYLSSMEAEKFVQYVEGMAQKLNELEQATQKTQYKT
ncbi:MAG: hydrogenase iron-sulfur subunit [Candidatus Latescibacteria bacterium]|nr:hydrogenase iron-sulfur subunit [Candidatus Latescibacterota bacterium]